MRKYSKFLAALALVCVFCGSVGCSGGQYFDDSVRVAEKVAHIGGNASLTLKEEENTLLLENENVRLVLNKESGAIRELANKETGLYLIRNSDNAIPLALEYVNGRFTYAFRNSSWTISEHSAERIAVSYEWEYAEELKISSTISLAKGDNEIKFTLALSGNRQADSVLNVEYPYLADVGRLYSPETDKFFHTFATGYVFDDPVTLFNRNDFNGIQWNMGMYPYGFGSTMQFMSYYVQDYGGFHFQTYDHGYSIKSFGALGAGDGLHLGIRHYLDDISDGDKEFYEIGISNLTQGNWTESCNRYYEFSEGCPWTQKAGMLAQKSAEERAFYEETTLCNFAPHLGLTKGLWPDWIEIYKKLGENIGGGKMFNIIGNDWQRNPNGSMMNGELDTMFPANVDAQRYAQMKENGYTAFFEFNNLYNINAAGDKQALRVSQATKDRYGNPQMLLDSVTSTIAWWYMCPSESWYDFSKTKTDIFTEEYDVDALYHDCGYAVAPRSCFDITHAHGTRVNIVEDEIAFLDRLISESGRIVGEELISEVFVGTVAYYQARGNAGGMGFMDNNDIRVPVDEDKAHKVPALDYVYHEHGLLRTDAYMKPLKESGEMYYYIMAYTALHGGVPQFNYEYIKTSFNADEMDEEMLTFLNTLSLLKTGEAKEYLTYGRMLRAPNTGAGLRELDYFNSSAIGDAVFSGTAAVDRVVTAAYKFGGKTAVLFSNVTAEDEEVRFVLNAGRDYGIQEGIVTYQGKKIASVKNGKANIRLDLPARCAVMIEIQEA